MDISTRIMAHRYLYYVLARPVISDRDYDTLEKRAASELPADHPVHGVGSDNEHDYSPGVRAAALDFLEGRAS